MGSLSPLTIPWVTCVLGGLFLHSLTEFGVSFPLLLSWQSVSLSSLPTIGGEGGFRFQLSTHIVGVSEGLFHHSLIEVTPTDIVGEWVVGVSCHSDRVAKEWVISPTHFLRLSLSIYQWSQVSPHCPLLQWVHSEWGYLPHVPTTERGSEWGSILWLEWGSA